ncbi:MAG: Hsp20/alpha crystallin family protein [Desulfovermiculus sp.]|nr:Hsp20/alpha crystallin family protein [Desulfovermiculus sp.]
MTEVSTNRELPRIRPAADIIQENEGFAILMDMPGVKREDLVISAGKNNLTVQADTSYAYNDNERFIENEFGNVHYIRKFTLSDAVDANNIKANLKNGLLKLHLPKAEELEPRKIAIQQE